MTRNAQAILVALDPSGKTPVEGFFSEVGSSGYLEPIAGRPFNITLYDPDGTFDGEITIRRQFANKTEWHPITAAGEAIYLYSAPMSEVIEEYEVGVRYKFECTRCTVGKMYYRISQ